MIVIALIVFFFFFNDTATTEIYTLSLHDALPISDLHQVRNEWSDFMPTVYPCVPGHEIVGRVTKVGSAVSKFKLGDIAAVGDRKSTRLNSSHSQISYAGFCLKKKKTQHTQPPPRQRRDM